MRQSLKARFVRQVPSPDGRQADVVLIEPNGDEHPVRCLMRPTGTEIGGDGESLNYLNEKYGDAEVCLTAQGAVLGICDSRNEER